MDGGKFNWSNGDPATVARNIRQMKSNNREFIASVHNSIGPALSYVTQGAGYAYNGAQWHLSGTVASKDQSIVMPFDPTYDIDMIVDVPISRQFTISVSAWVYAQPYIYTGNSGNQPATAQLRIGSFAYAFADEDIEADGRFGGAQILTSSYGVNSKTAMGIAASETSKFFIYTDKKTMHVRTRRWYWPYYSDNNGNAIDAPSGSWYSGYVSQVSVQVTPIYLASSQENTE